MTQQRQLHSNTKRRVGTTMAKHSQKNNSPGRLLFSGLPPRSATFWRRGAARDVTAYLDLDLDRTTKGTARRCRDAAM